jgi:hypothetical protein
LAHRFSCNHDTSGGCGTVEAQRQWEERLGRFGIEEWGTAPEDALRAVEAAQDAMAAMERWSAPGFQGRFVAALSLVMPKDRAAFVDRFVTESRLPRPLVEAKVEEFVDANWA